MRALHGDLFARRNEPRHEHGRIVYKLLDADEARAFLREPVIDRPGMGGEKAAARVARRALDAFRALGLFGVSRGLRRQAREQRAARLPEARIARTVAGEIRGVARRRLSSGCSLERQV